MAAPATAGALADTASHPTGHEPRPRHETRGAVTIKRDTLGIPHVYADTTYDVFRGYGYVVAQDRLFQMEMTRRATQGTVAEVLGQDHVAFDKDTRSGFDPASIKKQISALPKRDLDVLEGYAAGMNEHLDAVEADPERLMPKQFRDYGFVPSRWSAYDVAMVWVGTMANRYSDSSSELANYKVLQQLIGDNGEQRGQQLFDQIMWKEDTNAPTTVPRGQRAGVRADTAMSLAPVSPGLRDSHEATMRRNGGGTWPDQAPTASNIWITGKDRTVGAKSVLVNGPQFQWFNPSYVYGIGLHGGGFDVVGNTPFAYPSVIFGSNKNISWGSTAGPMNVVDVYQEQLDPKNPRRYLYNGSYRDMTVRQETIKVKGADDVPVDLLSTVHGYVSSVDGATNTAYSRRRSWSGLEVQSLMAWVNMTKTNDWRGFRRQADKFATSINWYYADKRGNIGYISPGRLPDRPDNQDFRIPAKGDGSMEWRGFLPPSANPSVYNPKQGYIANWNNQAGPGFNNDYGHWAAVDRDNEIISAFTKQRQWTPNDMWSLIERTSYADLNLRYLKPTLSKAAATLPVDDPLRRDIALITRWNGVTRDADGDGLYDGPQAAIMRAWLPRLTTEVLGDDLPASVVASYNTAIYQQTPTDQRSIRPAPGLKLIYNAMLGERSGVPQTVDFFDGQAPEKVLLETYRQTLASLRAERGQDMEAWTVPVSRLGYSYKNFLGVPQAGKDESLTGPEYANRGTANIMSVLGPNRARVRTTGSPGQSGFISPGGEKSPHYSDQLALYAQFRCHDNPLTPKAVNRQTESVTVLD